MQLFQVKDANGNLIMNAPLETIQRVWHIDTQVAVHILRYTTKLDKEYIISFAPNGSAVRMGWPPALHIQRLPLEIPSRALTATEVMQMQQQSDIERKRDAALAAWNEQIPENMRTTETDLGRLLCDE